MNNGIVESSLIFYHDGHMCYVVEEPWLNILKKDSPSSPKPGWIIRSTYILLIYWIISNRLDNYFILKFSPGAPAPIRRKVGAPAGPTAYIYTDSLCVWGLRPRGPIEYSAPIRDYQPKNFLENLYDSLPTCIIQ